MENAYTSIIRHVPKWTHYAWNFKRYPGIFLAFVYLHCMPQRLFLIVITLVSAPETGSVTGL